MCGVASRGHMVNPQQAAKLALACDVVLSLSASTRSSCGLRGVTIPPMIIGSEPMISPRPRCDPIGPRLSPCPQVCRCQVLTRMGSPRCKCPWPGPERTTLEYVKCLNLTAARAVKSRRYFIWSQNEAWIACEQASRALPTVFHAVLNRPSTAHEAQEQT